MATEGQIADYSQAQKFITSKARQDLTVLWREAQQLPIEQARRFLKEGVQALVDRYGLMAASVAADFFEALTGETAIVPESYSPAQIQASTNWALQDTSQEETAGALRGDGLERLASVTVRLVLQYGRNTIDTSVASTPGVLYARKIMGETCDFCLLLASRGPVYGDAQKAGGDGNSYHNDCDCVPVPCKGEWVAGRWEGDDPGYDYRRLYAEEYAPYHRRGDSIQQTLARKRRILKANQPAGKRGRPRKQHDDRGASLDGTLQRTRWEKFRSFAESEARKRGVVIDGKGFKLPPTQWAEPPDWWPKDDSFPVLRAMEWNHILYGDEKSGGHAPGYGWLHGRTEFKPEETPETIAKLLEKGLEQRGEAKGERGRWQAEVGGQLYAICYAIRKGIVRITSFYPQEK